MYLNILPQGYEEVINKILKYPFIKGFYLSGGTALALQLGHRESYDFDFFSRDEFNPEEILKSLKSDFDVDDLTIASGTLNCVLKGVKFQFLLYPYLLLEEFVEWNGISLSSTMDIACTKMITIGSRGSKKDFIDIFFLLQKYTLDEIFENMDRKYKGINFNKLHILKSLTSFVEADEQPMPKMHTDVNWETIKKEVSRKTLEYLKSI